MSLINEALKKAQRERTETTSDTPFVPEGNPGRSSRAHRDGPPVLLLAGGGALVALIVAGVFALLYFRKAAQPQTTSSPTLAVVQTVSTTPVPTAKPEPPRPTAVDNKPAEVASTKAVPEKSAPTAPTTFTLPLSSEVATAKARPGAAEKAAAVPDKARMSASTLPAAPVAGIESPAASPKPSNQMINLVENLKVTGIRAAGADSKVLMNDRVYRLYDVIDHNQGIRLTGIAPSALTFTDESGAVYTRQF